MAIAQADQIVAGLLAESRLLNEVKGRLIQTDADRARYDEPLNQEHNLCNANAIGRLLRCVAEHQGERVAVLTFCSAARHRKPRDHTQREDHSQVRHFVAARNLSLTRSLSIFHFECQRGERAGKKSLPDWLDKNHRHPNPLVARITP